MEIISCSNLQKKYGNFESLKNISFKIEEKGCVGFLGANGSGKTTTIRILTGLSKKTSGEVKVIGYNVDKEIDEIKKNIGYCPQHPNFYNYMTAMEWMYWTGSMYKLPKEEIKSRSEELLKLCGIYDDRKRKIGGFSGGMKQRLAIAQALLNKPKLLILDEPVSALDPMGRHDVLQIIEKLKNDMTIFMSSHILDDIEKIADKIVIIDKGETILSDSMDNIRKKYLKSIIKFTISGTNTNIEEILKTESWVKEVDVDYRTYSIKTTDFEMASREILPLLVKNNIQIESYSLGQSILEDIFLKVVNK